MCNKAVVSWSASPLLCSLAGDAMMVADLFAATVRVGVAAVVELGRSDHKL